MIAESGKMAEIQNFNATFKKLKINGKDGPDLYLLK